MAYMLILIRYVIDMKTNWHFFLFNPTAGNLPFSLIDYYKDTKWKK